MKTVRIGIVLGVCTLLLLTTCVTTSKNEEQMNELAIKELTRKDSNGKDLGYFTLREHNKNGRYGPVFIFTERHDSRLIQAEIAWGMDVLRETRGINNVALEGMLKGEIMSVEKLAYNTEIERYIVTLALLEHGDIKAPELMYLAMDSFVFGMENEEEYSVMQPAGADEVIFEYLIMSIIADRGIETLRATLLEISKLIAAESFDSLLSQNPWVYETIEIISKSRSCIERINRLAELEKKVEPIAFLLDAKLRAGFNQLKYFYDVSYKRSLTMANPVLNTLREKNEPLTMIIGSGHTEDVVEFFEINNVNYYVLEPRGLYDTDIWSDLTDDEYGRRVAGLPFFANNQIVSFFTNEHNPRPVVDKDWSRREDNFFLLTGNIIHLAENDIDSGTRNQSFFYSNGLQVSRDFLDISNPNDVKFFIENEKDDRLFVRVVLNPQGNQFESFQKALEEIIEKLYKLDELNPPFSERIKTLEGLIEVFNLGRYAVFISPSSEVWNIDPFAL